MHISRPYRTSLVPAICGFLARGRTSEFNQSHRFLHNIQQSVGTVLSSSSINSLAFDVRHFTGTVEAPLLPSSTNGSLRYHDGR
ncbi:hypothetical protein AVEN_104211-1 [Araneus ventricosus]|uniref:Uncharacterized protein n=1 Tax=Araneus ventricosus TaxID=182803 RepID=A0A4Y2JWJ4_ARAVE|nr:hypothetical protein AVEN_104211-1 [Araneus ventricosus]